MSPTTTHAYILRVLPFRESSVIGYLFTESHGLIHGVARGIRTPKKGVFVERGMLVETVLYVRPGRDLHTLGATAVVEAFGAIRGSLLKTAVRDVAFEVALSGISQADPHPELFGFFAKFLHFLESCPETHAYPFALWRFLYRFAALLGFGLPIDRCMSCGGELSRGGELDIASGGLQCDRCALRTRSTRFLPPAALAVLRGSLRDATELDDTLDPHERRRVTRLLADFCRYHFEVREEYRSLAFLEGVVS
jgi:DNA repair protein RecO